MLFSLSHSVLLLTFFLCLLHNHMNNMKYAKTVNSEGLWKFIENVTLHVEEKKKRQKKVSDSKIMWKMET